MAVSAGLRAQFEDVLPPQVAMGTARQVIEWVVTRVDLTPATGITVAVVPHHARVIEVASGGAPAKYRLVINVRDAFVV